MSVFNQLINENYLTTTVLGLRSALWKSGQKKEMKNFLKPLPFVSLSYIFKCKFSERCSVTKSALASKIQRFQGIFQCHIDTSKH